jgi:hypothetical protein
MTIIEKIIALFTKKQDKQKIRENIYLDKWERLKQLPDTYIGDIFIEGKIDDIAIALVHCDQKTKNRFFVMADAFKKEKLLKDLIIDYSNISKHKSDKMKARISNLSGLNRKGYIQYTNYN